MAFSVAACDSRFFLFTFFDSNKFFATAVEAEIVVFVAVAGVANTSTTTVVVVAVVGC